ncbi:MAG: hypothetical protein GXP34_11575 [Actinobacteria bacterium]|nr:hypothetical protein [Actinomycetota bacterium]
MAHQASLSRERFEDPYVVSQRLGHASIHTTYDVSVRVPTGQDREAANALKTARTSRSRDASMGLFP